MGAVGRWGRGCVGSLSLWGRGGDDPGATELASDMPHRRGVPGVHSAVWGLSFLSFYFLYPSTFNILEVRCARGGRGGPGEPREAGGGGGGQGGTRRRLWCAPSGAA